MVAKEKNPYLEALIYLLLLVVTTVVAAIVVVAVVGVAEVQRNPFEATAAVYLPIWLVTYWRLRRTGRTFGDIGLSLRSSPIERLGIGLLIGIALISSVLVILLVLDVMELRARSAGTSLILSLLLGFVVILFQSGTEELAFRGYLFYTLAEKGRLAAVLITATLFAVVHVTANPVGLLNIFLFGVLAALLVILTGNLWMAAGFHAGWNFFHLRVFGIPMYGVESTGVLEPSRLAPGPIGGGTFGLEGSIVTTVLLLLSIALAYRFAATSPPAGAGPGKPDASHAPDAPKAPERSA